MNALRLWWMGLCLCLLLGETGAQRFRPVDGAARYGAGRRYLIGTQPSGGTVRMMGAQTALSKTVTSRVAVEATAAPDGTFDADAAQAARFVPEFVSGSGPEGRFRLRDEATGGWLCYDTKGSSSGSTLALYTLSEADITGSLSADFVCDFSNPQQLIATAERVQFSASGKRVYYLYADRVGAYFRLYANPGIAVATTFYYEVLPPVCERDEATGVTTLRGEWTADELAARDWSGRSVLDLTEADLAGGWEAESRCALTYVRAGQADSLPQGWTNVVVLSEAGAAAPGEAVGPIRWIDGDTVWVKYAFRVGAACPLRYERTVTADGGYHSLFLPFAVTRFTAQGREPVGWDVCTPDGWTDEGLVLVPAPDGRPATAYRPYFLRGTGDSSPVTLVFEGGAQTVAASAGALPQAGPDGTVMGGTLAGWRPTEGLTGYGLNDDGTALVRLQGESHLRPFRACLYRSGAGGPWQQPILYNKVETKIPKLTAGEAEGSFGVYTIDGRRAGVYQGRPGAFTGWPRGLYIVGRRKLFAP